MAFYQNNMDFHTSQIETSLLIFMRITFILLQDVLTWNMEGLKGKLQRDETKYMGFLTDSFERWSKHSNLKFLWSAQNPDITIKFLSGFHGDPYPFFESSNSLGHAFYPLNQKRLSGDIHISYALVVKLDDISLNWFFTHSIGTHNECSKKRRIPILLFD